MLKALFIENIAVIEQADISFHDGFNVLSGETGAGKSIIIDALGAIMGGRVSREIIRTGETRAVVSAAFTALSPQVLQWLEGQSIGLEGSELVIRREIYSDGRNTCKINGRPASLAELRALGAILINIHGQHDGQHLLNEALHVDYLDAFGRLEGQLGAYEALYDGLLALNRKIRALSMSADAKERLRTRLAGQLEELDAADVKVGEHQTLSDRRARLIHGERMAAILAQTLAALDGSEDELGAIARMQEGEKQLRLGQKLEDSLEPFVVKLCEASGLASDISAELSGLLLELDFSTALLEETERRIELIARLCKRHSVEADALHETRDAIAQELDSLADVEHSLEDLNAQYMVLRARVAESAQALHDAREQAGDAMCAHIEAELHMLDMPAARFRAEIVSTLGESQAKFTRKGTDSVRFLLSTNSGEELRSLSKVASGGELSRIMLALKTVLSRGEEHMTAIFDEVDAGVSGRAASHVGDKLYAIARRRQVLCVTHLPQIASMADHQYHIEKQSIEGRTFTRVELLDRAGRIRELARLTAGVHISDATLKSAGQLLDSADKAKKA